RVGVRVGALLLLNECARQVGAEEGGGRRTGPGRTRAGAAAQDRGQGGRTPRAHGPAARAGAPGRAPSVASAAGGAALAGAGAEPRAQDAGCAGGRGVRAPPGGRLSPRRGRPGPAGRWGRSAPTRPLLPESTLPRRLAAQHAEPGQRRPDPSPLRRPRGSPPCPSLGPAWHPEPGFRSAPRPPGWPAHAWPAGTLGAAGRAGTSPSPALRPRPPELKGTGREFRNPLQHHREPGSGAGGAAGHQQAEGGTRADFQGYLTPY
ncbi:PREDICTED: collagen alpha-1(III) chain-like, partial [Chinchilla lanigera]|uniref:collagen alpha-1(III) chain-like n=1 Tax=Chinchilla lanigera TaxID=34839 RepID=UPI00069674FF